MTLVASHPSVADRISSILRHSRWLSGTVALWAIVGLFATAVASTGLAWFEWNAQGNRADEHGWLGLTEARLDTLAAADRLESQLRRNVPLSDVTSGFAEARSAIEAELPPANDNFDLSLAAQAIIARHAGTIGRITRYAGAPFPCAGARAMLRALSA